MGEVAAGLAIYAEQQIAVFRVFHLSGVCDELRGAEGVVAPAQLTAGAVGDADGFGGLGLDPGLELGFVGLAAGVGQVVVVLRAGVSGLNLCVAKMGFERKAYLELCRGEIGPLLADAFHSGR